MKFTKNMYISALTLLLTTARRGARRKRGQSTRTHSQKLCRHLRWWWQITVILNSTYSSSHFHSQYKYIWLRHCFRVDFTLTVRARVFRRLILLRMCVCVFGCIEQFFLLTIALHKSSKINLATELIYFFFWFSCSSSGCFLINYYW